MCHIVSQMCGETPSPVTVVGMDSLLSHCGQLDTNITSSYGSSNDSSKILGSVSNETISTVSVGSDCRPVRQIFGSSGGGGHQYPQTLHHEFALLNFDIPNVYIHKVT